MVNRLWGHNQHRDHRLPQRREKHSSRLQKFIAMLGSLIEMGVGQPVRLKTRHMTPSMRVGLLQLMLTISVMLSPAFAQPEAPSSMVPNYKPITERDRLEWFLVSTTGPSSLFGAGPLSAGLSTAFNNPEEYGPHWQGFGKRYGMRLTGVSTGNAIEATLGTAWGEDPRYFPSPNHAFGARVKYIIKTTFLAPRRDGRWGLAYARYAGNVGNNFLSNLWRVDSENDPGNAGLRCVWGITSRMGANAFAEFWPGVKKIMFKKKPASLHSAGERQ